MTRKGRRLTLIGLALGVLGVSVGLALYALRDNIVFFYSPSELTAKDVAPGTRVRIGGLVADGSLAKSDDGKVTFAITDNQKTVHVTYTGLLPDLFREGQGVVAEGVLVAPGQFRADPNTGVLAKHDENYMPREVADELKKQGLWHEGAETEAAAPAKTATQ